MPLITQDLSGMYKEAEQPTLSGIAFNGGKGENDGATEKLKTKTNIETAWSRAVLIT